MLDESGTSVSNRKASTGVTAKSMIVQNFSFSPMNEGQASTYTIEIFTAINFEYFTLLLFLLLLLQLYFLLPLTKYLILLLNVVRIRGFYLSSLMITVVNWVNQYHARPAASRSVQIALFCVKSATGR